MLLLQGQGLPGIIYILKQRESHTEIATEAHQMMVIEARVPGDRESRGQSSAEPEPFGAKAPGPKFDPEQM